MTGNNVSHSNRHTKTRFMANSQADPGAGRQVDQG